MSPSGPSAAAHGGHVAGNVSCLLDCWLRLTIRIWFESLSVASSSLTPHWIHSEGSSVWESDSRAEQE